MRRSPPEWHAEPDTFACCTNHLRPPHQTRSQILQQLFEYLHEHLQPWFKADAQAVLDEPDIAALRGSKYVSMHIRRTDKQIYDGASFTETMVRKCGRGSP